MTTLILFSGFFGFGFGRPHRMLAIKRMVKSFFWGRLLRLGVFRNGEKFWVSNWVFMKKEAYLLTAFWNLKEYLISSNFYVYDVGVKK